MTLLAALAVAFGASCIWLTVRIVNRRERWAKRTLAGVVVAALVVYPLSVGPMEWMRLDGRLSGDTMQRFYRPLGLIMELGPQQIGDALQAYSNWCVETLDQWTESSDE